MNISASSIKGDECIFESCDISLENTPTSFCTHAVILQWLFCHALAYAVKAKLCLLSFVSPSLCTVLLCFCASSVLIVGSTAPFETTSYKKGEWAYFRGWALSVRLAHSLCSSYWVVSVRLTLAWASGLYLGAVLAWLGVITALQALVNRIT